MSDFPQIAKNPSLGDWYHKETKIDHQYKTVVIEEAFNWEYVFIPGLEHSKGEHPDHIDYNRIPQSLHYDEGMKITWGWMLFQSGYRQSIPVKQGQRYTAVAKFTGDIRDTQDQTAIQWQFFVAGLQSATSEWSAYSHANQFNTPTEHQFVFQASEDGWIDLTFWAKTVWADNSGELRIRSIEIFEVPPDYGMAFPVMPYPNDDQHPVPGDDEPPTDTPTAPSWLLPVMLAVCGIIVGMIIYGVLKPRLAAQGVESMEIISITEAGNILLAAIGAILAGGLAAPVTQPVVNLLKFVLKLVGLESKVSANTLSLVVAAVVSVAIWLSRHFGMELQAANVMDWLAVALPIVLSGLSMFLSQKGMYALSQRYEIPLFGYQRSE